MTDKISITVQSRDQLGSAEMGRMRRQQGLVPGVVYGAGEKETLITCDHNHLYRLLAVESTHSQVLDLVVDGKAVPVVVKSVQRHPVAAKILHVDWLRINAKEKITLRVPLHFVGEEASPGIKAGGVAQHLFKDVEVQCLPGNLPEFIAVDISNLEMDHSIHCSDLKLPKDVELSCLVADPPHDDTVVAIHKPRVVAEEPTEEASEESGDASAEGAEASAGEGKAGDESAS